MPSEFEIERKVVEYAESLGWRVRKVQYPGRRGAPDRWFFRATAHLVIIEFKATNGSLSIHQRKEINRLAADGFHVEVIDSIAEGKEVFDRLETTC